MAFGDASEALVSAIEESTWGTTPSTPVWQRLRFTGETLKPNIENTQSQEITPLAGVSDLVQIGGSAEGAINLELSFGSGDTDLLLEHALRGTFATNVLKRGVEKKSLSLQKQFELGATDAFFVFAGMRANTLNLNFQAQSILNGSIGFLGKGTTVGTSEVAGATYTPANTNDVMSATGVATITVGGVSDSPTYSRIAVNLTNNCRFQYGLTGAPVAAGIGYGQTVITGELVAYFQSLDLYEEFVNGTEGSLSWEASDGTNTYTFTLPRIKYIDGRAEARGNNQDIMAEMSFQALIDSAVENTDFKIENA